MWPFTRKRKSNPGLLTAVEEHAPDIIEAGLWLILDVADAPDEPSNHNHCADHSDSSCDTVADSGGGDCACDCSVDLHPVTLLFALAAILFSTGCASSRDWYKAQPWTPDGFNYTLQRDRATGEMSDYFGFNWSLK